MKSFKDFNIKPKLSTFTGDKIKIDKVLNIEIIVHAFKIEDSKKKQGTKLLTLQIEKQGTRHVIFTGSTVLMQTVQEVPKDGFPFSTKIIKQDEHYEFT